MWIFCLIVVCVSVIIAIVSAFGWTMAHGLTELEPALKRSFTYWTITVLCLIGGVFLGGLFGPLWAQIILGIVGCVAAFFIYLAIDDNTNFLPQLSGQ